MILSTSYAKKFVDDNFFDKSLPTKYDQIFSSVINTKIVDGNLHRQKKKIKTTSSAKIVYADQINFVAKVLYADELDFFIKTIIMTNVDIINKYFCRKNLQIGNNFYLPMFNFVGKNYLFLKKKKENNF